MLKVVAECSSCGGTGLYSGFMEGKGSAVVCVTCGGTGQQVIHYKEYTGRKKKSGIRQIRFGSGLIIDNPSKEAWISYEEFERKVRAPKV